jgi:purine-binding chemotaxis protein CheW
MATQLCGEMSAEARKRAGKYLLFHLGSEEFGVHVLKVREIMGLQDITGVPHTARCVRGVINLRGKVVPVVDLRVRLSMPELAYSARTCIVVLQVTKAGAPLQIGIIVDGVAEVLNLQEDDVEDAPTFGGGQDTMHCLGMAKVKGKVKMLLDIDHVLENTEWRGPGLA